MPADVMTKSGAILAEVGTTNKTYLKDYENAITENTGLILKVHQSNFKIVGFTETVDFKIPCFSGSDQEYSCDV